MGSFFSYKDAQSATLIGSVQYEQNTPTGKTDEEEGYFQSLDQFEARMKKKSDEALQTPISSSTTSDTSAVEEVRQAICTE